MKTIRPPTMGAAAHPIGKTLHPGVHFGALMRALMSRIAMAVPAAKPTIVKVVIGMRGPIPRSVPEVAHAGENHREAGLIGGGDDLVVAHRAAGLDHSR